MQMSLAPYFKSIHMHARLQSVFYAYAARGQIKKAYFNLYKYVLPLHLRHFDSNKYAPPHTRVKCHILPRVLPSFRICRIIRMPHYPH